MTLTTTAGRATATGMSSRGRRAWRVLTAGALGVGALATALATPSTASPRVASRDARSTLAPATAALSRLSPRPAPAHWASATISSGAATLFYPPNWRPIPGDTGTVTAALRDAAGRYAGYLNVTPRQGAEQLAGWAAFRTRRNAGDGDKRVRELVAAEGVSFARARGSCVIDQYLSRVGAHPYRELACIVSGRSHTSVFVGAALVSDWRALGSVLDRAAASLVER
jgi:hypothetical protein